MAKEDWVDGDQVNAAALNALGGDINDAEESSDIAALAAQVADDLDPAALLALSEDLALADDDAFVMFDSTAGNTLKRAKWSTFKSGLAALFGNKVDKTSTANRVYGTDGVGAQTVTALSQSAAAGSVAQRDANGNLISSTPVSQSASATKQYADDKLHFVRTATKGTETFTIVSGTVTQITGLIVDGITHVVGDRILIKDAPAATGVASSLSTQPGNGIYTVTSVAGGNLAVSRASDFGANILGHLIRITEGTNGSSAGGQGGRVFTVCQPTTGTITYGTTPINIGDFLVQWSLALSIGGNQRSNRVASTAFVAAPTINVDLQDAYRQTAMSGNLTGITVSGSPYEGHVLELSFADNGTARALTRGGTFISGMAPMAATTIVGSTIRERYIFNAGTSKYECFESVIIGAARVKVTEYSNASLTTDMTGTGIKPAGALGVKVSIVPGGAGGGSGRRGAAGTARGGGGGGAGVAGIRDYYLPLLADTYSYILGRVGNGGVAVTTDNTDGNAGAAVVPTVCSFVCGSVTVATSQTSLTAGFGGTTAGGTGGNSVIRTDTNQSSNFTSGGTGGGSTPVGLDGTDAWQPVIPSGGGGGGGISAADVAGNGGVGGRQRSYTSNLSAGGVVDTTVPAVPANANTSGLPGQGGGGGAASKTAAAQAGADGVGYGAPGGGGGASLNGFNSGRGGNGGPSYMRLEWVYA